MRKFRTAVSREQVELLPRSIEEYVPMNDKVRYVDNLVEELDLREIEEQYSSVGRPGFSPRILVKLLLYGKMRGLRSSRELCRAASENLRFMYLCQNERPDFRTISLFRKRFHKELALLLSQTVSIGLSEGYITLEHVAVDGTKIGSFAGRNSYKDPKKLESLLAELEKSFKEDIERDKEEDEEFGDDDYDGKLPSDVQDKEALRKKLRAALSEYEGIKGKKPKKVSLTDPESRYMKGKGINPSYNMQAAVDVESRMAVGGYATKAACDSGELARVLEEIEVTTGQNPKQVSADKGYNLKSDLGELEQRGIEGFIAQREEPVSGYSLSSFEYEQGKDQYICPQGQPVVRRGKAENSRIQYVGTNCTNCPVRTECLTKKNARSRTIVVSPFLELQRKMSERMASNNGKRMAQIRGATVEPVFGTLKYAKKLRRFCFRGLKMVDSLWKLELAAFNLEKIVKYRMANQIPA